MFKKFLIYLALILVLTALAAFIYAFILYKSENEYLYNIITILLGALFFFLIGSSTRVITNQKIFIIFASNFYNFKFNYFYHKNINLKDNSYTYFI